MRAERPVGFQTTSLKLPPLGGSAFTSDDEVDSMLLHVADYIRMDLFYHHYEGNLKRIKSYLFMKKKYLYLLFTFDYEKHVRHVTIDVASLWLRELCSYTEFKHVHESQLYYKGFSEWVEDYMRQSEDKGWLCELSDESNENANIITRQELEAGEGSAEDIEGLQGKEIFKDEEDV